MHKDRAVHLLIWRSGDTSIITMWGSGIAMVQSSGEGSLMGLSGLENITRLQQGTYEWRISDALNPVPESAGLGVRGP